MYKCIKDGSWEGDVIILAVPSHEEKTVDERMKVVATQKIVAKVAFVESENNAALKPAV